MLFGRLCHAFRSLLRSAVARPSTPIALSLLLANAWPGAISPLAAADAAGTGTIRGRIQSVDAAKYLNNAQVVVVGSSHEAFTDESGQYILTDVPAGQVTLRVYYTGLIPQTMPVTVTPGKVTRQDFSLTARDGYGSGSGSDTVQLEKFVVSSTRETQASELAINEQRFSRNIKSVVSTDAFGQISENNLGEFVKYLPGVGVEYFANDITGINVRGFGSANTEITFNGLPSATSYTESNSRAFEMRQSSTADISRVEVRKVPLPSDSSNAIGGSVNLIRKTAFERTRRVIDFAVTTNSEDEGDWSLRRTPGPGDELIRKWRPSWTLSITDPLVQDKFGYSFNYAHSDVIAPQHWSQPNWNFGSTDATRANPWMASPLLHDAPIRTVRDSYSLTLDWRPLPDLTLSSNVSYFATERNTRDDIRYQWNIGGTPRFNDRYTTLGPTGSGSVMYNTPLWRDDENPKLDLSLSAKWKHNDWQLEGAGTGSFASHEFKDTENGFFNSTTFPLANNTTMEGTSTRLWTSGSTGHTGITNVTVNFYDQTSYAPQRIEVLNSAGQPVEWWKASAHTIRGARSRPSKTDTQLWATYLKARRDFNFAVPLTFEVGWQFQFEFRNRQRYDTNVWAFVGKDGIPNTADDNAGQIAADYLEPAVDRAYGYPAIEHISMTKLYQLYKDHPEYFRFQAAESYRQNAQQPMQIAEETNAIYWMFETKLLHNRLDAVGGVRFEKTAAEGRGFLQGNASYQKYADGTVKRSGDIINPDGTITSRGTPLRIPGVAANSLDEAILNYIRKGAYGRGENKNFFPSLHLSYSITDNLVARTAYAKTQAKVRFDRSTIPNTTITEASPSDTNTVLGTIEGRNPRLKPWTADNLDLRLEYYTKQGGVFAAGYFLKWINDFQTNPTFVLTDDAMAEAFGYPDYVGYQYRTWINAGKARVSGIEVEARQKLDAFLPAWARGFDVLASFGTTDLAGAAATTRVSSGDWSSLNKKRGTLYLHYSRGRWKLGLGYIYQGEIFQQPETLAGEEGDRILEPRELIDAQVEFALNRHLRLLASVRNLTGEPNLSIRQSPTAAPWARVRSDNRHGANYTIGVNGTF